MESSWRVLLAVDVPILLALSVSVALVAGALRDRSRLDHDAPCSRTVRAWQIAGAVVLALGLLSVVCRVEQISLRSVVVGAVLFLSLCVYPVQLLATRSRTGVEEGRRVVLAALSLFLLGAANVMMQTLALSPTVALEAVSQVGEVRLFGYRPDVEGIVAPLSMQAQFALMVPSILPGLSMFYPSQPLLWPLAAWHVGQLAYQTGASWVMYRCARERGVDSSFSALLGLAVGLSPIVLHKLSWDFLSAGTLFFLLAYWAELRGRRLLLALWLALAATGHPIMAGMAFLWGMDHLRRSWAGPKRGEAFLVPILVMVPVAVSASGLLVSHLLAPEASMLGRLAFYSRETAKISLEAGDWAWVPGMLLANAGRAAVILGSIAFLPVLRKNRFLVFLSLEAIYSGLTLNGFDHGSLPGSVGLLGCAALENAKELSSRRRSFVMWGIAATLLPLTLWWGYHHFAVKLFTTPSSDRAAAVSSVLTDADRSRSCVGQASVFPVLAGRCAHASPIRHGDDVMSTLFDSADVYVLDFRGLEEDVGHWGRPGLGELFESWSRRRMTPQEDWPRSFDWWLDLHAEDMLELIRRLREGELEATVESDGVLRLEKREPEGGDSADETSGATMEVMSAVLSSREAGRR